MKCIYIHNMYTVFWLQQAGHWCFAGGSREVIVHTGKSFQILFNQTEIRLCLPFSDWLGTANGHCPFNLLSVQSAFGTICFRFDWIRFEKISLCISLPSHRGAVFTQRNRIQLNFDCNYTFPIDLASTKRNSVGAKSIGKSVIEVFIQ